MVAFPIQPFLFAIPSLAYLAINKAKGRSWSQVLHEVGWTRTSVAHLAIGLFLGILPGALLLSLPHALPPEIIHNPSMAQSVYAAWPVSLGSFLLAILREASYVTLGEEILFRGFLGGLLMRRVGFALGNVMQASLFLLPHLLLLTVSRDLWPLLPVQFVAGWLFGWLLHRSGSILPGWVAHSLANAFGALAFMQ